MTIANWECGVLLPGTIVDATRNDDGPEGASKDAKRKGAQRPQGTRVGAGKTEVRSIDGAALGVVREDAIELLGMKLYLPFSVPARRYDDGEKPWMQTGSW